MENQEDILDSRPGDVAQPQDDTAAHLVDISIDKVRGEVSAFNKIEAGLAKLAKEHPADLVVDVTTPAGMKVAITARAAWRDPRVALERARKSAKAPVLDLGRKIDAYAADIEERLRIGEDNYDAQIKVETERKAREKKEAEEKEAARVAQIQARIAFHFTTVPMRAVGKSADELHQILTTLTEEHISEAWYAELSQTAIDERQKACDTIVDMHTRQKAAEEEAHRQRTQTEENARKAAELKRQQEEFEEEQRAMRERIQREANERQAKEDAERRERQAELDKIEAARAALAREKQAEADRKAAAERAEADRLAAIERKRLDDEAQAERARLNAEATAKFQAEEAERVKVEAKQRRAAKKLAQVQKCGPRLLAALDGLVKALDDCSDPEDRLPIPEGPELYAIYEARNESRQAIDQAEAE